MKHKITRRAMIRSSAAMVGCICGCRTAKRTDGPPTSCCFTPDLEQESIEFADNCLTIDLAKAPSLQTVGGAAEIRNMEKVPEIIIVHPEKNKYVVLSRFCTHGGQALSYVRRRGLLQCNSYNHSIFDLNGDVVKGPAPRPLKSYHAQLIEDKLVIAV